MNMLRVIPSPLRLGTAGSATGVAAAVVTTAVFGGSRAIWWWPAGTLALAFAGFMAGWMLGQELQGGRIDDRDEAEAIRLRREAGWPDSPWDSPC